MIFVSGQTKNGIESISEWIDSASVQDSYTLLDSLNTSQVVDYYDTYTGNTVIQYEDGALEISNSEETITFENEEDSNGDSNYTFYITETFPALKTGLGCKMSVMKAVCQVLKK